MGYVLAVRASHSVTVGSGRAVAAAEAAGLIPARAWQRMRTGSGTKGTRPLRLGDARGDQRQSWHRLTALCLLAYLYLAVAVAVQRQQEASSGPDAA